jgi:hypothetical protein
MKTATELIFEKGLPSDLDGERFVLASALIDDTMGCTVPAIKN